MPITEYLERNAREYGNDVCLVEVNPDIQEKRRVTWRDYELIEPDKTSHYRREITWSVFNEKANRFANHLIERGIRKGDKVAILLMNCLEWLPIYFGILKTGSAWLCPLISGMHADEIQVLCGAGRGGCAGIRAGIYRIVLEEIADDISAAPAPYTTCGRWTARHLQKITTKPVLQTVPVSHSGGRHLQMKTMRQYTFHRERQVSQKQYYISTVRP